ncbi:MAG: molybdate ABC transporter substrate-binding protein [Methylococcales bacterium]|nr:molybdate ABC transporter substrate-binding protein [Methylococcales bacterium]
MTFKQIKFFISTLLILISPSLFSQESPVIAAASSVKFALEEISHAFTTDYNLKIKLSFSSSGNLMRQIHYNSPFELFISADENYVLDLYRAGLTLDKGIQYAQGRLVLFTMENSSLKKDKQLVDVALALKEGRLKRFAIANPDHAPYGRAAKQVLQKLGLWQKIQKKLVLGENVAQAAQFSRHSVVQGGIFAYSFALKMQEKQQGSYILLPSSLHQPLLARMVLLKKAGATAKAFYHYLQQPKARAIFEKHGFSSP